MKIFSAAFNLHDHNTYDGIWHNQRERYTRRKHNIPWHFDSYPHHSEVDKMNQYDESACEDFFKEYWQPNKHEVFAFTTTGGALQHLPELKDVIPWVDWEPTSLWDYKQKDSLYYIDHHQSHAAYAYLLSGYKQSDILAIDGRGSKYNCIFVDKEGKISDLSEHMGIGMLWNWFSKYLGFGFLGASKVMGLVGYGEYLPELHMRFDQYFDNDQNLNWFEKWKDQSKLSMKRPEDIAKTLQVATEERIEEFVYPLKSCDNLCVSGGVAYNGYMNEMLTKQWTNVFVPPAPGDEGQSIGTYMHADYMLNNNIHKPSVYSGKEYDYVGEEKVDLKEVAQAIADGKIVGWFQGKSESGNRALGNRSILADPRNPDIKNIINRTIKNREDFRPFAPSVLEEHYERWFHTSQPSPYMSRIMLVKIPGLVPGITHVDGTARMQTVNSTDNPRFYQLIHEFYKITKVPMVLNTSFNCQEPIVETPEEAINTFQSTQMDILVINDYILRKMG